MQLFNWLNYRQTLPNFPFLFCILHYRETLLKYFQGIDAMDTSGESHIDIVHNIYKRRLDLEGQPIEDPQREQGLGETKKILNATKAASNEQV